MTTTTIPGHSLAAIERGERMPYAARCECGYRTLGYAAEWPARDMHAAHVRQVAALADALRQATGCDPLGEHAAAFDLRSGSQCEECGRWTVTALVCDRGDEGIDDERRVCVRCIAW